MRFDLFLCRHMPPWDDPDFYDAKDRHELCAELLPGYKTVAFGSFGPYTRVRPYPAGVFR